VARTGEFYAPDAHFRDPFNDVRGVERIARIYAHMFEQVSEPRFAVIERYLKENSGGDSALLLWEFSFRSRPGAAVTIVRGTTHLRFDAQGRVSTHQDYWDPAGQLYENVPLLGTLLRWVRGRLRAPQD
jgi:steroid delta-isomerase